MSSGKDVPYLDASKPNQSGGPRRYYAERTKYISCADFSCVYNIIVIIDIYRQIKVSTSSTL